MAKKQKQQQQERLDTIGFLGKDLARRAKRKCELCQGTGDLRALDGDTEVEPSLETLVLSCLRCRTVYAGKVEDVRELRFLESAIWNEEPIVAAVAKQMLAGIASDWAREALELVE